MRLKFSPESIERWPLTRLRPYVKNTKTHGVQQVAKIAASMSEFGWTVPCLVGEDGELIAGHGRVLAAEKLGLTEAPVIVLRHLTETQRRAYRIADNKLPELGAWDDDLLHCELNALEADDFDLSILGFDEECAPIDIDAADDKVVIDDMKYSLLVEYQDEQDLKKAYDDAKARGLKCKIIE